MKKTPLETHALLLYDSGVMRYRRRHSYTRLHRRRAFPNKTHRSRRRSNRNPVAGILIIAILALLAGLSAALQFAKQNPAQAAGLGVLAFSPVVFFVWLKLRARGKRKWENELRQIAERERQRADERAARAITESDIDRMTGEQLELYLERVFRYLGFEVEHTGKRGDQGADLILTKDGHRVACQCKRYSHPVTNKAVQEALAASIYHRCQKSLVVTSNVYTKSARELANRSGCELIDRRRLGMIIATYREDRLNKRRHLTELLGLQP